MSVGKVAVAAANVFYFVSQHIKIGGQQDSLLYEVQRPRGIQEMGQSHRFHEG